MVKYFIGRKNKLIEIVGLDACKSWWQ